MMFNIRKLRYLFYKKFQRRTSNTMFNILQLQLVVITFYSPSWLGQETAKGPFGLRVKLQPAHLSTTHGGGFTLTL